MGCIWEGEVVLDEILIMTIFQSVHGVPVKFEYVLFWCSHYIEETESGEHAQKKTALDSLVGSMMIDENWKAVSRTEEKRGRLKPLFLLHNISNSGC